MAKSPRPTTKRVYLSEAHAKSAMGACARALKELGFAEEQFKADWQPEHRRGGITLAALSAEQVGQIRELKAIRDEQPNLDVIPDYDGFSVVLVFPWSPR